MKKLLILLIIISTLAIGWHFAKPLLSQEIAEETTIIESAPSEETSLQVPEFTEVKIDFEHHWNKKNLAFSGGALIDIDKDGTQEVFVTGGMGEEDGLFKFQDGEFINIIEKTALSSKDATYGAISLDVDNDEDIDLIIARETGLYIYYNEEVPEKATGPALPIYFRPEKIEVEFAKDTIPLTVTAGDINKDGWVDLYVSTFIEAEDFKSATFNNTNHGKPNIMLLNNGNNTFADITNESGLTVNQNTFLSAFVDLNNDTHSDLVVCENTGQVRIFKNLGTQNSNNASTQFEEVAVNTGFGFWMGLAIDDVDQDGDMDIFATNSGNTVPTNLAKGDLKDDMQQNIDWVFLRNNGDFNFKDDTKQVGLSGYEFAWGAMFDDFNLDGFSDLTVLENYIKWPAHKLSKAPGRFFIQNFEGKFLPTTKQSGLSNEYYGMSPLVSDFNQDGYNDLIFVNLNGPTRAFINKGGDHNHLTIRFKDNAANIGTHVVLNKNNGNKLSKQIITGLGLLSDSAAELKFGLGKDKSVASVEIFWPSGKTEKIENPEINKIIRR